MTTTNELEQEPRSGLSDLTVKLDLPWHIGFSDEVAGNLCGGTYQPDLTRYSVHNICGRSGKVQAFATSFDAAKLIVDSINSGSNVELSGRKEGLK